MSHHRNKSELQAQKWMCTHIKKYCRLWMILTKNYYMNKSVDWSFLYDNNLWFLPKIRLKKTWISAFAPLHPMETHCQPKIFMWATTWMPFWKCNQEKKPLEELECNLKRPFFSSKISEKLVWKCHHFGSKPCSQTC